jgi:hypothetical protein
VAWRDLVIIMVWLLWISSFVQGVIHYMTAWVSGHQKARTSLGPALTRRELSLGIKATLRFVYDLLVLLAVTWQIGFSNSPLVAILSVVLSGASIAAIYYGIRYITVLRREYWGQMPVATTRFSEDTADTIDATAENVVDVQDRVRSIEGRLRGLTPRGEKEL